MPVSKKRSAVVASTSAGTSFDSSAPNAGTSIAVPDRIRSRPSAWLVAPTGDRSVTSPTAAHYPLRVDSSFREQGGTLGDVKLVRIR